MPKQEQATDVALTLLQDVTRPHGDTPDGVVLTCNPGVCLSRLLTRSRRSCRLCAYAPGSTRCPFADEKSAWVSLPVSVVGLLNTGSSLRDFGLRLRRAIAAQVGDGAASLVHGLWVTARR